MSSHQVLNIFSRFSMCSPRVFPIAPRFNPICFTQSPPLLTYIGSRLESSYSSFELRKEMMTVYLLARSNRPSVQGAKIPKALNPLIAVSKAGVNSFHILRREMMSVHSSIRVNDHPKNWSKIHKAFNPLNICFLKLSIVTQISSKIPKLCLYLTS